MQALIHYDAMAFQQEIVDQELTELDQLRIATKKLKQELDQQTQIELLK